MKPARALNERAEGGGGATKKGRTMKTIQEKAVLANLSISRWSPTKIDRKVTAKAIADNHAAPKSGRFSKSLLPEEALETLGTLCNEAREYHYSVTRPWKDDGKRILPSALVIDYTSRMRGLKYKFATEVAIFLKDYPSHVEAARTTLNGMFSAADYPDAEKLRERFSFQFELEPIPSADDFRITMVSEEFEEAKVELEQRVAAAVESSRVDLWQRLAEPLRAIVHRLGTPDATFRDSLLGNLRDLLKLLPALNIEGDVNLAALADECAQKIAIYGPDYLRHDALKRRAVAGDAQSILDRMAGYMQPAIASEPAAACIVA
jgi:hypothetical protein